jgi:4-hydroxyacetophenone monooxygenase
MTATRNTDPVVAERSALDPETARCAVDAADLRALLMMVYHHTGDSYWLTERFRPARDVRLIAPEDAGLPGEVQREIRDAATDVLCRVDPPAVSKPDDALFLRMMSFALNEDVPAEYVPMMREQMGFCSLLAPAESPRRAQDTALPVLVVGAGESGIALGAVLSDLGIEYQIIERAESSGGTWRDNIYPGCAVDTPNHAYSYSFGPHYGWTRFFSARAEIEDYLHTCSTAFGVEGKISFGTRCVSATWDDRSDIWQVIVESRG